MQAINDKIRSLYEAGIVDYWLETYTEKSYALGVVIRECYISSGMFEWYLFISIPIRKSVSIESTHL